MKRLCLLVLTLSATLVWAVTPPAAEADSGHARIVRLSLVQGDVRYTREFHKDSIADSKALWEVAPLNLPIREGYALATDNNGRAEVEFENGAMAFLSANTLLEFYDLSLDEGAHITRLILRQGSAIFYVQPAKEDYFSVTGGDFSVEANGRTRFRLDNFDDGSIVNVEQGHINVLRAKETKALEKGQSYSINLNDGGSPVIARTGDADDFDKWVSGRIDSVATATTYSNQYLSSASYVSGFGDLYNYGSFINVPGYGFGWQPFGMGLGWDPFDYGSWYYDSFGWGFIGSMPWGWLPYHYGGWVFSPVYGWVWMPTGFGFGGPVYYQPVTAVFVHSGTTTGVVPMHPLDIRGKTPLNLAQGVYALQGSSLARTLTPATGEKWSVSRSLPREAFSGATFTAATQPARVSRTILASNTGNRVVTLSHDSSIVYDPGQHQFINSNKPAKLTSEAAKEVTGTSTSKATGETTATVTSGTAHPPNAPAVPRANVPARPNIMPPPRPASAYSRSSGERAWGGSHGSEGMGSAGSSMGSSASSASSGSAGHSSGGGGHH